MPSPSQPKSESGARAAVVIAALLFSTGGAAIKFCAFDAFEIAFLRSLVAAVAVWIALPESRQFLRPKVLVVGVCYAATLILFVNANKLTTAANAIYLQSTAPVYVVLLGPLLLGERLRRLDVATLPLLVVAMVACFLGERQPSDSARDPLLGDLLAVGSGVCWAGTVVGLRWLARANDGATASAAVVAGNLIAAAFCAGFALPLASHGIVDWAAVVYLGVFQIGLAYVFLVRGLPRLPVVEASLLLLVEPVLNPVWAFLLEGEVPAVGSMIGGALILATLAARSWFDRPTAANESNT
jgi:DME family drug/metabolite transporter